MVDIRARAYELGIKIGTLERGRWNAITDIAGVRVGHVTLIKGDGPLKPGEGPIRTGVTVIIPHGGNVFKEKVKGAAHIINGFGKSMGLAQIMELGTIETPIVLTNTLNVGIAADALIEYMLEQNEDIGITTGTVNPVIGECNDGFLNDIRGRHVKQEHIFAALQKAAGGPVEEGGVGAGTGTSAFGFKGGIGTASREVTREGKIYTVGTLVLTNFGRREDLLIDGVPVGRELMHLKPEPKLESGSIMIIIATDAPLSSRQLTRIAKRATLGLARTGSTGSHGSGDFVIAFSTVNRESHYPERLEHVEERITESSLNPFFKATIESTEEAIINSLLKAETMRGRDGNISVGMPIDRVVELMKTHGRMYSIDSNLSDA